MSNDPINPDHYKGMSNGAEVIDIAENLSYNGGCAVKYIARATRQDGRVKGAVIEDLDKAVWYLKREKGRLLALAPEVEDVEPVDVEDVPVDAEAEQPIGVATFESPVSEVGLKPHVGDLLVVMGNRADGGRGLSHVFNTGEVVKVVLPPERCMDGEPVVWVESCATGDRFYVNVAHTVDIHEYTKHLAEPFWPHELTF